MNTDNKNDNRQRVSSVGNAWIVCQSKSHPGNNYYFNTLTREAVWNLSEAEREKARAATKIIESQSGSKTASCPEPEDNPPLHNTRHQFDSHNTFHQRQQTDSNLINQQQPIRGIVEHQQPEAGVLQAPKPPGAIFSAVPMTDLSPIDLNALNNQINAFNIINTPAIYNPNGWAIHHPQQFLITPAVPFGNHAQAAAALNVGFMQSEQAPLRKNHINSVPNGGHRGFQLKNTARTRPLFKRSRPSLCPNDLRQQLSLKRRLSCKKDELEILELEKSTEETPLSLQKQTVDLSTHIADTKDAVSNEQCRKDHNSTSVQNEETQSKLNLKPLKCLATNNDTWQKWYIVVDLNILLEEFNFLSNMTDSDEYCTLLVPDNVMSELKDYIARSNNIPARLIFHSLSQLIKSGRAYLGKPPSQDLGESITNPILKTCFSLLEENVNLILLTNDNDILRYKKFIKVNMLTVDEVKNLLEHNSHSDQPKAVSNSNSLIIKSQLPSQSLIKTNVPDEQTFTTKTITKESTHVETTYEEPTHVENDSESELSRSENSRPLKLKLKSTTNAAIQTDIATVISDTNTLIDEEHKKNLIESSNKSEVSNIPPDEDLEKNLNQNLRITETSQESSIKVPIATEQNISAKRKAVTLKRSVSTKTILCSDVKNDNKKPFRWRRKRHTSLETPKTTSNKPPTIQNDMNAVPIVKENDVRAKANIENETEQPSDLSEIVESVASSVICLNTVRENITIEETSTSGIISNTESNVDTEYCNYKDNHNSGSCNKSNSSKDITHIDSDNMEESLKTKCEEWISRFIQIMEEVLAVVLHKELAFSNSELPPPWSLHEATLCIGKYSNVPAIKSASDKLSSILFNLGDSAGKISMNMTPSQYMEMYSCGLSLVDEIKAVTTYNEDVEIAEESLKNLLIDIKNPNYGSNYSEIDAQENMQESGSLNESFVSNISQRETRSTSASPGKYNLRSRLKVAKPLKSPQAVKIIRKFDTKTSFFSNLNLQKIPFNLRSNMTKTIEVSSKPGDSAILSKPEESAVLSKPEDSAVLSKPEDSAILSKPEDSAVLSKPEVSAVFSKPEDSAKELRPIIFSSPNVNGEPDNCSNSLETLVKTPNIVRNFTKCAEFEERLRNKFLNTSHEELHDAHEELHDAHEEQEDGHDEEELENEEQFTDYEEDYEYTSNDFLSDYDSNEVRTDPNVTQLSELSDMYMAANLVASSPKPVDPSLATEHNNTFKFMIKIFLQEVRNAINEVKVLCVKCYAELQHPQLPKSQKQELISKTENARVHLKGLSLSLESMLNRDSDALTDNIKTAMKNAGINISHIDEDLLLKYWSTIANCKKYADVFLSSIQEIIAAFKSVRE